MLDTTADIRRLAKALCEEDVVINLSTSRAKLNNFLRDETMDKRLLGATVRALIADIVKIESSFEKSLIWNLPVAETEPSRSLGAGVFQVDLETIIMMIHVELALALHELESKAC
ncbi:MAG: hypothetical protein IJ087_13905 [Eggerthellaceae bacterium]|nr:hypothetical protein [Eggerthellaceae bacterium]